MRTRRATCNFVMKISFGRALDEWTPDSVSKLPCKRRNTDGRHRARDLTCRRATQLSPLSIRDTSGVRWQQTLRAGEEIEGDMIGDESYL